MKICICTIGKQENKYILEYIEYYKNFGVDKIYLYDNNNINGEYFNNIAFDYINQGFIKVKNWRGIKSPQMMIYHDCYNNYYDKYDWIILNVSLFQINKKILFIKVFLHQQKFKECQNIQLNWLLYTDNNKLYYENKSLIKRFIEKDPYMNKRIISKFSNGKSILRGRIPNITIYNFHCISDKLQTCDGFGIKRKTLQKDYNYYYFKHYYCKSTQEFIEKLKKGDVYKISNHIKIKFYFGYNKITFEKLNYVEKETGMNLSLYKNKLMQKNFWKL